MPAISIGAVLSCAGLMLALAGAVSAETASSAQFPRSEDEKSLTDLQLLGKRIFEDKNLSEPRGQSCASCHAPEHAFQGNNGSPIPAVALGSTPGKFGIRKTPTIMYKTYSPAFGFYKDVDEGKEVLEAKGGQFWDGRASDLVEQPMTPLLNPIEMNNPSIEAVVEKVKTGPYADLVASVYGADVFQDPKSAMRKLAEAIFAYEFDRALRAVLLQVRRLPARQGQANADPSAWVCDFHRPQERQLHRLPRRQDRLERPNQVDLHRLHL